MQPTLLSFQPAFSDKRREILFEIKSSNVKNDFTISMIFTN